MNIAESTYFSDITKELNIALENQDSELVHYLIYSCVDYLNKNHKYELSEKFIRLLPYNNLLEHYMLQYELNKILSIGPSQILMAG